MQLLIIWIHNRISANSALIGSNTILSEISVNHCIDIVSFSFILK